MAPTHQLGMYFSRYALTAVDSERSGVRNQRGLPKWGKGVPLEDSNKSTCHENQRQGPKQATVRYQSNDREELYNCTGKLPYGMANPSPRDDPW